MVQLSTRHFLANQKKGESCLTPFFPACCFGLRSYKFMLVSVFFRFAGLVDSIITIILKLWAVIFQFFSLIQSVTLNFSH